MKKMNHQKYINRCLQLAKNGIGSTRPNPSVGAVLVFNNKIIGEGYTSPYGGNHAEVNAINSVKDKKIVSKATIYVTLEPCSHYGKTPPCADFIIKYKIKNVVIGCIDTNPLVQGKGVERLKNADCNVTVGILEKECLRHHKRFFTVQNKKRPYIILKWAETKDGFIAPKTKNVQNPIWISNQYSQQLVHKWRSKEHAILVGTNTIIADNPKLNVRSWGGNNPIRIIVLDKNSTILKNVNVLDGSIITFFLVDKKVQLNIETKKVIFQKINFSKNVAQEICNSLYNNKIQSVIIEGGKQTLQTFINANLWDEARIFIGNKKFEEGIKSPKLQTNDLKIETNVQGDILKIYENSLDIKSHN